MNHKSTTVLLGAVFAVTIGIMGLNGVFSIPSGIVTTTTDANAGVNLLGHVTVIVNGQDGEIKAYRQMDNIVTLVGRTCASASIFGNQPQCTAGTFQYIAIGTATQTELSSDTGLYIPTQKNIRTTYS